MIIPMKRIEKMIYIVRGQRVMLDRDLADLYCVKTIRLREQVKRNNKRFPSDFMFQLTEEEVDLMVSQNAIPSRKYLGGHLPYVFSEHGALMMSSVLNTDIAINVGIMIVRAFVKMREILSTHKEIISKINEMEEIYDSQFKIVFDALRQLIEPPVKPKRRIGFLREEDV